jgi:hypothetical protein
MAFHVKLDLSLDLHLAAARPAVNRAINRCPFTRAPEPEPNQSQSRTRASSSAGGLIACDMLLCVRVSVCVARCRGGWLRGHREAARDWRQRARGLRPPGLRAQGRDQRSAQPYALLSQWPPCAHERTRILFNSPGHRAQHWTASAPPHDTQTSGTSTQSTTTRGSHPAPPLGPHWPGSAPRRRPRPRPPPLKERKKDLRKIYVLYSLSYRGSSAADIRRSSALSSSGLAPPAGLSPGEVRCGARALPAGPAEPAAVAAAAAAGGGVCSGTGVTPAEPAGLPPPADAAADAVGAGAAAGRAGGVAGGPDAGACSGPGRGGRARRPPQPGAKQEGAGRPSPRPYEPACAPAELHGALTGGPSP